MDKRWSNAAIWKWCDLDKRAAGNDFMKNSTTEKDNAVSRHELFPVRAPLQAMEHCIGKFLDQCDPDGNHLIELKVVSHSFIFSITKEKVILGYIRAFQMMSLNIL